MDHEKNKIIPFKGYYLGLTKGDKSFLLAKIEPYISKSHFHLCVKKNKFSPLQIFFLESLLNQKFKWD